MREGNGMMTHERHLETGIDILGDALTRRIPYQVEKRKVGRPAAMPVQPVYTIQSGITIPERKRGRKSRFEGCPYPFGMMQVGDSFLISRQYEGDNLKNRQAHVLNEARRLRVKITTRETPEGVRVWRVK